MPVSALDAPCLMQESGTVGLICPGSRLEWNQDVVHGLPRTLGSYSTRRCKLKVDARAQSVKSGRVKGGRLTKKVYSNLTSTTSCYHQASLSV